MTNVTLINVNTASDLRFHDSNENARQQRCTAHARKSDHIKLLFVVDRSGELVETVHRQSESSERIVDQKTSNAPTCLSLIPSTMNPPPSDKTNNLLHAIRHSELQKVQALTADDGWQLAGMPSLLYDDFGTDFRSMTFAKPVEIPLAMAVLRHAVECGIDGTFNGNNKLIWETLVARGLDMDAATGNDAYIKLKNRPLIFVLEGSTARSLMTIIRRRLESDNIPIDPAVFYAVKSPPATEVIPQRVSTMYKKMSTMEVSHHMVLRTRLLL
jgi:hypothetical protein